MTELERADKVVPKLVPSVRGVDDMQELMKELTSTKKKLQGDNSNLTKLIRRIEQTENNMYIHMHSVGAIRNCLESIHKNHPKDIINKLQRSERKILTKEDMRRIRREVDNQLGIKSIDKKTTIYLKKPIKKAATRNDIMNTLIKLNGRMTEFSNIIRKSVTIPELRKRQYYY